MLEKLLLQRELMVETLSLCLCSVKQTSNFLFSVQAPLVVEVHHFYFSAQRACEVGGSMKSDWGGAEALQAEPQVSRGRIMRARETGNRGHEWDDYFWRPLRALSFKQTFKLGRRSQSLAPPRLYGSACSVGSLNASSYHYNLGG